MRVGAITDRWNCIAATSSGEEINANDCIDCTGGECIRGGGDSIISKRGCRVKPKQAEESV